MQNRNNREGDAHFTEPQALAPFEKPLFPLTRLAPAAQIWNKVIAIGR